MSAVNNNAFSSGFPIVPATPEFGSVGQGSAGQRSPGARDTIGPNALPAFSTAVDGSVTPASGSNVGWNGGSDSGLSGFDAIMNGFVKALQSVLASIEQKFGLAPGSGQSAALAQTYFTDATADSVGDPHETFAGTPTSGPSVAAKWDSMNSHADLLDSDSFGGGYQVSTTVTSPNGKGVTTNAQAQVALDGGATKITMNADGSYSVFEHGLDTSLEQGRAQSLGDGESVTLNADNSLSVEAKNSSGGSLVTTLRASGGGVDVKNTATNVDLGGYLVTHSDDSAGTPGYGAVPRQPAPIAYAYRLPPDSGVPV